ncbi:MAG: hypothetical protein K8F56_20325, partial [Rhodocyclaceae bacterium]|nr:hypothetical protein [Rhodocyclaceae bacterium]
MVPVPLLSREQPEREYSRDHLQLEEDATLSVTTRDIFGAAPAVEPATPGSYGEAPSGFRLPAETSVGAVTLQVADLERSLEFYRATLGLAEIGRDGGEAVLGAGARPLVELRA